MKSTFVILVALTSTALLTGCNEEMSHQENTSASRIGIYDSRSVAVAFTGSRAFRLWMQEPMTEFLDAKVQEDQPRMKEIEAEFERRQTLLHTQGFSTAPVDNILEFIQEDVESIRHEKNLEAIVSKWDTETLNKYPSATQVDITMDLVDALDTTEKQRQSAIEIQSKDPIPLEEVKNIRD